MSVLQCGPPMTRAEFEAILADETKSIRGAITWSEDEDHSPWLEFRSDVLSEPGYPMFIQGSYNRTIGKLRYSVIHRGAGRIYGLCMGSDHHNPTCQNVSGDRHLHLWNDQSRDKEAIVATAITAPGSDPVGVWQQFCTEFRLE